MFHIPFLNKNANKQVRQEIAELCPESDFNPSMVVDLHSPRQWLHYTTVPLSVGEERLSEDSKRWEMSVVIYYTRTKASLSVELTMML